MIHFTPTFKESLNHQYKKLTLSVNHSGMVNSFCISQDVDNDLRLLPLRIPANKR